MLTVKDMLNIIPIKDMELVAGESGLSNVVKSVNIMDNPEALDWLSAGEALLSSGYFFKDSTQEQNRFLENLNNIGCPCLCIKPKRFLKTIPQNMIDQANELGFPIIEIPYGLSFSKIMTAVTDQLSDKKDMIKKSLEIHDEFFKISLEGGGLLSISKKLSAFVGNPIILLDSNFGLLNYCDFEENEFPLAEYLDLKQNATFLPKEFIENLPYGIDKFRKLVTRSFETEKAKIKLRIMPSTVAEINHGYIILWESMKELMEIDFIAIEKASIVFAIERIRAKELEEVKTRLRGDYFDDLITGKITSSEDVKNMLSLLRININYQYCCAVVSFGVRRASGFDDMIKLQYIIEEKSKQIVRTIQNVAFSLKRTVLCFLRSSNIVVLIGKDKHLPEFSPEDMKEFATDVCKVLLERFTDDNIKIGIGRTYNSALDIKSSYAEACEAISFGEKFDPEAQVCHLDDFLIYKFLNDNIEKDKMAQFFTRVMGALEEYDKQNNTNYMKTLEYYLLNNCNATEASKQLYIHRNTFFYRIEKIKKIMNSELNDSGELFNYNLAIKIHKLIN